MWVPIGNHIPITARCKFCYYSHIHIWELNIQLLQGVMNNTENSLQSRTFQFQYSNTPTTTKHVLSHAVLEKRFRKRLCCTGNTMVFTYHTPNITLLGTIAKSKVCSLHTLASKRICTFFKHIILINTTNNLHGTFSSTKSQYKYINL